MRHLVLGTAGHIDHGKSALVHALTGVHPDRLAEEKRRGITIDLGFADLQLDPEHVLSFVDVPGHERFVRHMVAGASGIDAVLFVVAADDGVRPQTREHLEICSLLGIEHGLVALTKIDLLDDELREVAALEVREFLERSFLARAPLLPVSSRTGEGMGELRHALRDLVARVPERAASGQPRLPVDRSFVLAGFGTVVTGTVASGTFHEGEEVEVLPGGGRARIRGLQVHRHGATSVRAGQRAAVNLAGIDRDEAPRGATLTRPDALLTTRRIWARIQLSEEAGTSVARGGTVRFHQGTCERAARVRLLGDEGGGGQRAEILLGQETVLVPGDRFILRRPAPVDTVGGGVVTDIRPPRSRRAWGVAAERVHDGQDPFLERVVRAGRAGADIRAVARELGLTGDVVRERARRAVQDAQLVVAGDHLIAAPVWAELERDAMARIADLHARDPLAPGIGREALRAAVARQLPHDAWRSLLAGLESAGHVRLTGEHVASASHRVVLSERETRLANAIERKFSEAGLDPPGLDDVLREVGDPGAHRLADLLVRRGRLVRIQDGRLFHADALQRLREGLRDHRRASTTIDVATFKQLFGVTRKNAIPLLEQLDAERRTRRVGNLRQILDEGGSGS